MNQFDVSHKGDVLINKKPNLFCITIVSNTELIRINCTGFDSLTGGHSLFSFLFNSKKNQVCTFLSTLSHNYFADKEKICQNHGMVIINVLT